MAIFSRLRWALCVVALVLPSTADSSMITFNIGVTLDAEQIYDCGGGGFPFGTMCWTTDAVRRSRRIVDADDTIRVNLKFRHGERLQWADDGVIASGPVRLDEGVQVTLWNSRLAFGVSGLRGNSLAFNRVSGDLLVNNYEWDFAGTSGGIVLHSYSDGLVNLTDSAFQFSGITAELGPFTAGSGLPQIVDRLAIHFSSGRFEFVPKAVPEPATLALLGIGGLGVLLRRCRRRSHAGQHKLIATE